MTSCPVENRYPVEGQPPVYTQEEPILEQTVTQQINRYVAKIS